MPTTSQTLLARHLSMTFGLTAVILGLGACEVVAPLDDEACLYLEVDAECPSEEDARDQLVGNQTCEQPVRVILKIGEFLSEEEIRGQYTYGDTGSSGYTNLECCYEAAYRTKKGESCIVGRPLLHDGKPLTASVRTRKTNHAWVASGRPDVDLLTADEREALREHWLDAALLEHASVGSFAKFALNLLAHGAPPNLLVGAHTAAADEIKHARLCFALASAYAGETLTPGTLDLPEGLGVAPDLATLARDAAIEGCIGETIAVMLAAEQLRGATDPAVRDALHQIVEDEARHAELAWATLRWALQMGGDPVRAALEEVFSDPSKQIPMLAEATVSTEDLSVQSHGLPKREALLKAIRTGLERVVMPAAKALLA